MHISPVSPMFQGANILVFPEDGIYGMLWLGDRQRKRDLIQPYLEHIPESTARWNPCTDPQRFQDSDIQVALSCMARKHGMYIVANFGDRQPCNRSDPGCPDDGRFQYNTDIVYDPDGNFIAKYHKYHLYGEHQFDKPPKPETVVFDTPFGRFGLFTCFDVLFEKPAVELIRDLKIANIVFPTDWNDVMPYLSAVGFHSSFAKTYGVNFLAANIHKPLLGDHGSGIYTKNGAADYYYNNSIFSGGKLLVKTIPVIKEPQVPVYQPAVPVEGTSGNSFSVKIMKDTFNVVKLKGSSGTAKVCQNKLCCNVTYQEIDSKPVTVIRKSWDFYALAAFDGLHKDIENYYIQVCSIIRCRSVLGSVSCDKFSESETASNLTLTMFGNFSTPYIYPQVLLERSGTVQLTPYPNQWTYDKGYLTISEPFLHPLHTAAMVGRVFQKDEIKFQKLKTKVQ